jgi:hypothetical protein
MYFSNHGGLSLIGKYSQASMTSLIWNLEEVSYVKSRTAALL